MNYAEAQALVGKHGNKAAAARAIGISKQSFGRLLIRLQKESARAPAAPGKGRPLAEFRAEYDKDYIIPARIKAALAALGDGWDYEVNFAKLAGVSLSDLALFREKFPDHVVQIKRDGKRAWAGTGKTAQQMRDML
jgi:hypothetical protein